MPYICQEQRDMVDPNIDALVEAMRDMLGRFPNALKGVANYTITRILLDSMRTSSGWNYNALCDVIGTLESAKQEIYRRLVGPYEDGAVERNGDLAEFGV